MSQRTKNLFAALVVLSAGVLFLYTLYGAVFGPTDPDDMSAQIMATVEDVSSATSTTDMTSEEVTDAPRELPSRFVVPKLSIDAHVQHVGLTKKGAVGIPTNYTDVAWYMLGVMPGQSGVAIIDGHLDNGLALPGVFHDIDTLERGDVATVVTDGGTHLTFMVDSIEEYPYDEVPMNTILAERSEPRLALITCAGDWIAGERTYDTRLIVYLTYIGREDA